MTLHLTLPKITNPWLTSLSFLIGSSNVSRIRHLGTNWMADNLPKIDHLFMQREHTWSLLSDNCCQGKGRKGLELRMIRNYARRQTGMPPGRPAGTYCEPPLQTYLYSAWCREIIHGTTPGLPEVGNQMDMLVVLSFHRPGPEGMMSGTATETWTM